MRHVNIQEVGMKNYGPYLDPMVLEFKDDSLILITGPNGIGKTMALDAIPFTLFGITSKGMKGDDVVNNVVGKNCKTWVKFSVNDEQYLVTRYQKYNKLGNTVVLNKGGVDIKKGQKEVLPEIEKLICSKRSFMNTLMFGQKVKDFFTDLVDSDKKQIFRELLALEQYQIYYEEAKARLKIIKEELEKLQMEKGIKEGLIEDAKAQIEILKEAEKKFEEEKQRYIDELKKSNDTDSRLLKEWQVKLGELNKKDIDISTTSTELATAESQFASVQSSIDPEVQSIENKKQTKLLEIKDKANEAKNEIREKFKASIDSIKDQINEIKDKANDFVNECQNERHEVESKVDKLSYMISSLHTQIHDIETSVIDSAIAECPLCQQEVSEDTLVHLKEKVDGYKEEIEKYTKEIDQLKIEIKAINQKMFAGADKANQSKDKLNNELQKFQTEEKSELLNVESRLLAANEKVEEFAEAEIKKKKEEIQESIEELRIKIQILTTKKAEQQSTITEIDQISKTITDLENTISARENSIKTQEQTEYDKTQMNSYIKKIGDIDLELRQIEEQRIRKHRRQEVLEFWKTAFSSSGIPSMLIDEAIPFMNEKVGYYLEKFTNGRYIVSFDTLAATKAGEFRDKISVNVIDTYTRANSRVQLSGGQTRIVDIATILTLADLQENIQDLSINILLFDEIFDSLDEENIGYVSKVLSKLKIGKSIYLISHRHEDQLEADEVLSFH